MRPRALGRVTVFLLLACPVVLAALAGCGAQSGAPSGSIKVTMTEYKFDPSKLTAGTGKVDFYLVNAGTTSHDMVIADSSGQVIAKSDLIQAGDSRVFEVSGLSKGSFQVYCDVPGHRESGMTATLDVT